jgi:hypothetical protein
MEKYLEDESLDHRPRRSARRSARARCPRVQPRVLRVGPQEHRRAASDRRRDRLPAQPQQVPEVQGTDPKDADKKLTRPHDEDAPRLSALVFKVVKRHARRPDLHPRLLGQADQGQPRAQPGQRQEGDRVSRIFEMHAKDRRRSTGVGRQYRRGRSGSRTRSPATRSATRTTRSSSSG